MGVVAFVELGRVVALVVVAAGWSGPGLGSVLTAKGYVAVPIREGKVSGWWYVTVDLNGKPATMIVDTGAAQSALDLASAPQYGYIPTDTGRKQKSVAGEVRVYQDVHPAVTVGPLKLASHRFNIHDINSAWSAAGYDGVDSCAGILGAPFLKDSSAVLDYGEGKMYLLDPAKRRIWRNGRQQTKD